MNISTLKKTDKYVLFLIECAGDDLSRDQIKWAALNRLYALALEIGDTEQASEYDRRRKVLAKEMGIK